MCFACILYICLSHHHFQVMAFWLLATPYTASTNAHNMRRPTPAVIRAAYIGRGEKASPIFNLFCDSECRWCGQMFMRTSRMFVWRVHKMRVNFRSVDYLVGALRRFNIAFGKQFDWFESWNKVNMNKSSLAAAYESLLFINITGQYFSARGNIFRVRVELVGKMPAATK